MHFVQIASNVCSFNIRVKGPRFIADYGPVCSGRLVELDPELMDDEIILLGLYEWLDGSYFDAACVVVTLSRAVNNNWRPNGSGLLPFMRRTDALFSMPATTDADNREISA